MWASATRVRTYICVFGCTIRIKTWFLTTPKVALALIKIDQSAKRNVRSTHQNVLKMNHRWRWKCVGATQICASAARVLLYVFVFGCTIRIKTWFLTTPKVALALIKIDQSAKRNVRSTHQNVLKMNHRWRWKCVGATQICASAARVLLYVFVFGCTIRIKTWFLTTPKVALALIQVLNAMCDPLIKTY